MNNKKYVRVMDRLKSNAGGFEYKVDEINISEHWNPKSDKAEEFGGFNFTSEDKVLRWLHRGDTIYDVIVPDDAEIVMVDADKWVYRSNKIIVTNPRIITDEMVIYFYNHNTLSDKSIYQCLVTMLWKDRIDISKYIIKDFITMENIDVAIKEFEDYSGNGNFSYNDLFDSGKEIYDILKEIQSPLDINLYIDKEPYVQELTDDKIINLTGQSGSGKSTFTKQFDDSYCIIDTDEIFSDKRFENATGINKELGIMFRDKYDVLPNLSEDFDLIYIDILNYCSIKNDNKTIVIDCAQFHCIKDLSILKGKLIVMRTSINTCYDRCIDRYKKENINYTDDELNKYKTKKLGLFEWYKYSNKFIESIDEFSNKKKII